jgi:hypothetical protein
MPRSKISADELKLEASESAEIEAIISSHMVQISDAITERLKGIDQTVSYKYHNCAFGVTSFDGLTARMNITFEAWEESNDS